MDIREQVAKKYHTANVILTDGKYEVVMNPAVDWEGLSEEGRDYFRKQADQIIPLVRADMQREIGEKPKIICLCGSTRFTHEMLIKQWELTKQGYIVVSWCALPDDYFDGDDKTHIGDQEGVKEIVDEVHMRKIDLCDEVICIHTGEATNGLTYIGESTYNEISYAFRVRKPVIFSPPNQALQDNWNYEDWRKFIGKPVSQAELKELQSGTFKEGE